MDPTLVTNLLGSIGLGAASGLNAWIPLFGLGVAERLGLVTLTAPYDRVGSTPALVVLGALLVIDLVGDKVPVVDHVLHVVGMVVAPVSGAVMLLAQENLLSQSHPGLAAAAGVALGGTVHLSRSAVRPVVTAGTAGAGNPVVSAVEDIVSLALTVLAVLVPVLAFVALLVGSVVLWRKVRAWRRARAARRDAGPQVGPPSGPPPLTGPRAAP
ncbi:MAG: DUF4126 domain-containing protein [Actinomycetes bacterium]